MRTRTRQQRFFLIVTGTSRRTRAPSPGPVDTVSGTHPTFPVALPLCERACDGAVDAPGESAQPFVEDAEGDDGEEGEDEGAGGSDAGVF
jgi:hypothetical protein